MATDPDDLLGSRIPDTRCRRVLPDGTLGAIGIILGVLGLALAVIGRRGMRR